MDRSVFLVMSYDFFYFCEDMKLVDIFDCNVSFRSSVSYPAADSVAPVVALIALS